MRIALITDLHLGYKENTSQSKSMYEYVKWFIEDVKRKEIDNIFILGDIFDNRESINYLTIKNTYENLINPIVENNLKAFVIAGNHDLYYKNTNDVYSVKLLFGHIPNLHFVQNLAEELVVGNSLICLVPWINSENYEQNMGFLKNCNADYVMGHFEISGFTMVRGVKCTNGLGRDIFKKYKKVFSGHFHLKENIGNIYYLGTPYEKDWNDYNSPKGYHILDLDNNELEFIENKNKHFVMIEYKDGLQGVCDLQGKEVKLVVNSIMKQTDFNKSLEELYNQKVTKLQIIDNTTKIKENEVLNEDVVVENLGNNNLDIFKNYVENITVDESIDKNELSKILIDVYNESLVK